MTNPFNGGFFMQVFRSSLSGKSLVALVCALALGVAACGSTSSGTTSGNSASKTQNASTGSTKSCVTQDKNHPKFWFGVHGGGAIFAFYRYIYQPARTGAFKQTAPDRRKALRHAAAAAIFTAIELRNARNAALSDERLCKFGSPIATALTKASPWLTNIRNGKVGDAEVNGTKTVLDVLKQQSGLKERKVPVPGA
jgi:hypothetical protein